MFRMRLLLDLPPVSDPTKEVHRAVRTGFDLQIVPFHAKIPNFFSESLLRKPKVCVNMQSSPCQRGLVFGRGILQRSDGPPHYSRLVSLLIGPHIVARPNTFFSFGRIHAWQQQAP